MNSNKFPFRVRKLFGSVHVSEFVILLQNRHLGCFSQQTSSEDVTCPERTFPDRFPIRFRYPPLLEKLREIVWQHHRPPSWDLCEILVTPGAQDGICKAVEMSLREGEAVIVQNPTYSGTACLVGVEHVNATVAHQSNASLFNTRTTPRT